MLSKKVKRNRIHIKIRKKISGTKDCPRLCVFRSNNHIYAQLVDDNSGKILASASDVKLKDKKGTKVQHAIEIGKVIAKEAQSMKIEKAVFDRGGFIFHGRIKAVADGAKEAGLKF
ncbi:MAG: 50S ribosomal protein L18 [Candidatus Staskawiczbacteria bacterium RIFCSPHIGHO2_02_FULL_34_9]|uniref:Large ribosomal subunit protein uL18 n=1 Tax=Candidatus Staskawiczbacteria bacterium RIFCSPHIGHO2_02_FULL_34_9 TaxID=1802206 RepID=A0A1G2HYR1_9BACT|nr:MAG: 50S ribosomal protein L18 [Candidatus Staskawiczbacteria bacterium RIFCSPHIGHO2_02_FULL_34_9]